jgi:hypothetical protein
MTATFSSLLQLDRALALAGHHPLTLWWRNQLDRFYAHPTAHTLVARVGRGGAKSHTSAKVALNETLFGDWRIPPGERHYWAFASRTKDEASQRLTLLQCFLRDLGVAFDVNGDEIALRDLPRGFRVFACQIGAVSGFRCYGYSADELAKWQAEGRHPGEEVCVSLDAMTITHGGARRLPISSAFGTLDHHAKLYELGNTERQIVACATSWEANPDGITEERARAAASSERVFLREYCSIPQADASAAWPPDVVQRAFRPLPANEGLSPAGAFGVDDPSSGRRDAWVSMVARMYLRAPTPEFLTREVPFPWTDRRTGRMARGYEPLLDRDGRPIPNPDYRGPSPPLLVVEHFEAIEGAFWQGLPASELVKQRAAMYRSRGVSTVFGDQREAYLLESAYRAQGIRYIPLAWSAENKGRSVERLRRWLAEETIILPANERLRRELLGFQEKILPSGHITFEGRTTDDHVAVLVTMALADVEGLIPASPIKRGGGGDYSTLPDFS